MWEEEEKEKKACSDYFDRFDSVLERIVYPFKKSKTITLFNEDWEIMSKHIKGLAEVWKENKKINTDNIYSYNYGLVLDKITNDFKKSNIIILFKKEEWEIVRKYLKSLSYFFVEHIHSMREK